MEGRTEGWRDRQTDRYVEGEMDGWTHRHNRRTDQWRDKQTDRKKTDKRLE